MQNTILLDITTHCNLDCIFCYRGQENHHKLYNHMKLSDVKKLFDRNSEFLDVSLINKGEMFVNPDFMEIFRYIIEEAYLNLNIRSVFLFTNGTLFKPEYTDEFMEILKKYPVKFRVNFSLNAVRENTYKKLTGKNLIKQAYANTEYYIKKAFEWNKNNSELLEAVPQSLILKENRDELIEFINYWENFFLKNNIPYEICEDTCITKYSFIIALKRVYLGNISDNEVFYEVVDEISKVKCFRINEDVESGLDFFRRKACDFLFNQPVMNDEWVTLCCRDLYFDYKYRKISQKETEKEVFYKNSHFLGEFENIRICEDCFNYKVLSIEDAKKYSKDNQHIIMYLHRLKNGIPFDFYSVDGDSNIIEEFLIDNECISFSSKTSPKSSRIMYSNKDYAKQKNNEEDFCIFWKGRLQIDKEGIFAGCKKQIKIKNFQNYSKKLEKHDYSLIPDSCIECKKKLSYDSLRDRFRIFNTNNFSSPIIKQKAYYNSIFKLKKYLKDKDEKSIKEIIEINFNFNFFKEFFENIRKFEFDSELIMNLFLKTDNLFLIKDYSIWSDKNFEKTLIYQIENIREYLSENQIEKLLIYYIDEKLNNKILIKKAYYIIAENQSDIFKIFSKKENIDNFIVFMRKKIHSINDIDDFNSFFEKFQSIILLTECIKELEYKIIFFIKNGKWKKLKKIIEKIDFNQFYDKSAISEETAERIISEYCEETQSWEEFLIVFENAKLFLKTNRVLKKILFLMVKLLYKENTEEIIEFFFKNIEEYIKENDILNIFYENSIKALIANIKDGKDLLNKKELLILICKTQGCYEMLYSFSMEIIKKHGVSEVFVFFKNDIIKDEKELYKDFYKNLYVFFILNANNIQTLLSEIPVNIKWFENETIKNTFISKIIELSKKDNIEEFTYIFVNSDYFSLELKSKFENVTKNILFKYLNNKSNFKTDILTVKKTVKHILNKKNNYKNEFIDFIIEKLFLNQKDFVNVENLIIKLEKTKFYEKQIYLYKELIKKYIIEKKFFSLLKQMKKFGKEFTESIVYSEILSLGFRYFDYRFIKLLIYLDFRNSDDYLKYKIFSFYMQIKKYNKAQKYINDIINIELFWNDKEFVSTLEFLEIHTGSLLERFRKKLFKFLK
ncbi:MAG: radical SAM protein [Candidatus Muirbacterium halophilum]|nr:radical SAM protein [Candidatus Muirbacterium halophilum]MCK9476010.1 radical SAM protein [Candidatus Muirbacterium halophilum]